MSRTGSTSRPTTRPVAAAVWIVALDEIDDAPLDLASAWLDSEEQAAARAKRDRTDRRRVLTSRVALRTILGRWLRAEPADVRFGREACPLCGEVHGRPVLAAPTDGRGSFSLARAGGHAAIALTPAPVAIGVDIEVLPPRVGAADLAAAHHPAEASELAALPRARRDRAALRCWARTEAVLKGWGTGLGVDPAAVLVGLGTEPAGRGVVRRSRVPTTVLAKDGITRTGWTVADIGVDAPLVLALAVGRNERAAAGEPATVVLADVELHEVALGELVGGADDRASVVTSSTPRRRG